MPVADERSEHVDVFAERRAKLESWRAKGDVFPTRFQPRDEIATLLDAHRDLEAGQDTDQVHRVAGRVIARRVHGKLTFVVLKDATGEVQLSRSSTRSVRPRTRSWAISIWATSSAPRGLPCARAAASCRCASPPGSC